MYIRKGCIKFYELALNFVLDTKILGSIFAQQPQFVVFLILYM